MNKKRVLVCDNNDRQFGNLKQNLEKVGYEVVRSYDYRNVEANIEANQPVHLLVLDLGFPEGNYVGHTCLPSLTSRYPEIKIVVYSQIVQDVDRSEEALQIARELVRYPQVKAILSPSDRVQRILFEIDRVMETTEWLRNCDEEIWMLHISDLQFGGKGLPHTPEPLVQLIERTLESFVNGRVSSEEEGSRQFPWMALITGDLSQRGRPDELAQASDFRTKLFDMLSGLRSDMRGAAGNAQVVIIPGNHDVNWDIARAQNLHVKGKQILFDKAKKLKDLQFIKQYSWAPFIEMPLRPSGRKLDWVWDPGYDIVNLKKELGVILVCYNSSLQSVDHMSKVGTVTLKRLTELAKTLKVLDADKSSTRILLVHHSLSPNTKSDDQLKLFDAQDERSQLIDQLSRVCGFAVVVTGHIHELAASYIDTGSNKRQLVLVSAGTIRSGNRKQYRNPQFNILRIANRCPATSKFRNIFVYPFHWDGSKFSAYAAFEDGMDTFGKLDLAY